MQKYPLGEDLILASLHLIFKLRVGILFDSWRQLGKLISKIPPFETTEEAALIGHPASN